MTAAGAVQNSKSVSPSNQDQRPREPSMEDILASIRRIIADDQSQIGRGFNSQRRVGASPVHDPAPDHTADSDHQEVFEEIIDLARMPEAVVAEPVRPPAVEAAVGHAPPQERYEDQGEPASHAPPAADQANAYAAPAEQVPPQLEEQSVPASSPSAEPDPGATDGLMSPTVNASVMSAFETLAATVVLQNTDMLDRVMHDLMRPLIKGWLDDNLPTLVERLVRVEIERMARGGRA